MLCYPDLSYICDTDCEPGLISASVLDLANALVTERDQICRARLRNHVAGVNLEEFWLLQQHVNMHGIEITSMTTYVGCSGVHIFYLLIYLETVLAA